MHAGHQKIGCCLKLGVEAMPFGKLVVVEGGMEECCRRHVYVVIQHTPHGPREEK
jgi:hypothetical protein